RCYFFFFQAEDGIRDFHVTGVQTCALPISLDAVHTTQNRWPAMANPQLRCDHAVSNSIAALWTRQNLLVDIGNPFIRQFAQTGRSEERRVGKECRSRWWADR